MVSKINQGPGDRAVFPPKVVVAVKAIACELPSQRGLPFSRFSHNDIAQEAIRCGIVASISGATVWRWLSMDAIKPWRYRSWIFPRDPNLIQKAARVLDLYHRIWNKKPLKSNDYVISTDEKTSIQARNRKAPECPPAPSKIRRVEHEYDRCGSLAYLAAWDVHKAKGFGICKEKSGIDSFHELVDLVMQKEPYRSANRVFWIADNGSSHRGEPSVERMFQWYPNAILVHTPVHASWLNQIEIYFSIVQRKVLTPNDFESLDSLKSTLINFQIQYEKIARPFKWKFTKEDLNRVLSSLIKVEEHNNVLKLAA
jgi:hypothetical protein